MNLEEKFIKNIETHKGNILSFRIDEVLCPNGVKATRDIIDHNGGVCVGALTDEEELIFIKQFRYSYEEVILELPAGKLEKGENADKSAGFSASPSYFIFGGHTQGTAMTERFLKALRTAMPESVLPLSAWRSKSSKKVSNITLDCHSSAPKPAAKTTGFPVSPKRSAGIWLSIKKTETSR